MKQEFVPYEEALAMQELGFNDSVIAQFSYTKEDLSSYVFELWNDENTGVTYGGVAAPLYQQAFRWFREKYKLRVSFMFWNGFNGALPEHMQNRYELYIIPKNGSSITVRGNSDRIFFNEHEEAQLACLQQLIKIVQDERNIT